MFPIAANSFVFVIDNDFFLVHHGCRRMVFMIASLLKNLKKDVTFLFLSGSSQKEYHISDGFIKNNGFSKNFLVGTSKDEIRNKLSRNPNVFFDVPVIDREMIMVTDFDKNEKYDVCIYGGPWLFRSVMDLPSAESYYCIAHDIVPNRNYFSEPEVAGLRDFAFRHKEGYCFFATNGNGLLAVTKETCFSLIQYGFASTEAVHTLPIMLPPGFEEVLSKPGKPNGSGILLAAPFDPRKGMALMPDLLNASGVKKLTIFGRPRCSHDALLKWFDDVNINDISWWMDVGFDKQVELYSSAKLVLFPSLQEGLGLPILEAMSCGTPILVQDIAPTNALVPVRDVLALNFDESIAMICSRLAEDENPGFYKKHLKNLLNVSAKRYSFFNEE